MAILAACLAIQIGARCWCYGDILPNTYYLKLSGFDGGRRIVRGLTSTLEFIRGSDGILFLLALSAPLFNKTRATFALLCVIAGQVGYSIYVGGDAWEPWGGSNRYISIIMPELFVLLGMMIGEGARYVSRHVSAIAPQAVLASMIVVSILMLNSQGQSYGHAVRQTLLMVPALHVDDDKNEIQRARLIDSITTPNAKVAVVWAGTLPYFADRYSIDMLGKNDARIGHIPMRLPYDDESHLFGSFYPGHMKWDYAYSIGTLRPDVVVDLWFNRDEAEPFLEANYRSADLGRRYWFRKDSPEIKWNEVEALAAKDASTSPCDDK